MLADALAPHGGVVIWRAFVYRADVAEDRAKQAYLELAPLDGSFRPNVCVQVKNGPIDFQPREPIHPLFGAMPRTRLMLELQLTQEYLGQGTHLAYLAPLFKEVLDTDTYANGPRTTVASIVDGSVMANGMGHLVSGIVAVANTGDERNWCRRTGTRSAGSPGTTTSGQTRSPMSGSG
jgi:alpha-glucuronidase